MSFFRYTTRPYGYEPLEGNSINFILLPQDIKTILIIIFIVSLIAFILYFYTYRKYFIEKALFCGFVSASVLTGFLFSLRSDFMWLTFSGNIHERYASFSPEERFKRLEVQNEGIHQFFMTVKPYISGDYRIFAPNITDDFATFINAKAHFIMPPLRISEYAQYLIVIDNEAFFNPATGILTSGNTEIGGLEQVVYYARGAFVLRRRQ